MSKSGGMVDSLDHRRSLTRSGSGGRLGKYELRTPVCNKFASYLYPELNYIYIRSFDQLSKNYSSDPRENFCGT